MGVDDISVEYLSTGANRQTAVADWSVSGVLAFGADDNVALWRPKVRSRHSTQDDVQHSDIALVKPTTRYLLPLEWSQGHCQSSLIPPSDRR